MQMWCQMNPKMKSIFTFLHAVTTELQVYCLQPFEFLLRILPWSSGLDEVTGTPTAAQQNCPQALKQIWSTQHQQRKIKMTLGLPTSAFTVCVSSHRASESLKQCAFLLISWYSQSGELPYEDWGTKVAIVERKIYPIRLSTIYESKRKSFKNNFWLQQNTGIWQRSVFFFWSSDNCQKSRHFSVFIVANFRHFVEKQGPRTWCQKVWQVSVDFDLSF